MATDPHINKLLERCQQEPELTERAWVILREYHSRGLMIAASGGTTAEKERLLHAARERMRTDLCDLVQPFDLDGTGEHKPLSPAADATQQTTPGG